MVRPVALDAIFALCENPNTVEERKECVRIEVRSSLAAIAAKEKERQKEAPRGVRAARACPGESAATRVQPPLGGVRKPSFC